MATLSKLLCFSVTIGKFFDRSPHMSLPPHIADIFQTMSGWFIKNTFATPAERLLVFNVAEGWEPLCRFLEKPVPATPFPRSHSRDEFWAHFGGEPA